TVFAASVFPPFAPPSLLSPPFAPPFCCCCLSCCCAFAPCWDFPPPPPPPPPPPDFLSSGLPTGIPAEALSAARRACFSAFLSSLSCLAVSLESPAAAGGAAASLGDFSGLTGLDVLAEGAGGCCVLAPAGVGA